MRRRRQTADARGILRVLGIQAEFQDAVLAAHLLIVPVIIAVTKFGEISMTFDKPRLRRRDHPVRLRRRDLLRHSTRLTESGVELEAHSGTRDAVAVVSTL